MRGDDWREMVAETLAARRGEEPPIILAAPLSHEAADALRRGEPVPAVIEAWDCHQDDAAERSQEETIQDIAAAFSPELQFAPSTSRFLAEEIFAAIQAGKVRHIHLDQ